MKPKKNSEAICLSPPVIAETREVRRPARELGTEELLKQESCGAALREHDGLLAV
jgi:hypothetical protein